MVETIFVLIRIYVFIVELVHVTVVPFRRVKGKGITMTTAIIYHLSPILRLY